MQVFNIKPPYAHHAHLPYAHEPWKSLYVFQRLFTTLFMVPYWVVYYSLVPRARRPRPSWSIKQIVNVNFTRRIYKITEVAGVTWGTREPDVEPDPESLKDTRFLWVNPLPEKARVGIIVADSVPFKRVGCYVWPKSSPLSRAEKGKNEFDYGTRALRNVDYHDALEFTSVRAPLVGIFMHGGGYCHLSAHESSKTSRIPRKLIQDNTLAEVYSVEYRLLQHAPFPAVIQDAAAVYAYVVREIRIGGLKPKIFLIGDSSGGNLVLSLTRWIRDEGKLPMPDGLLLLSPSCDISHALPETQSSYVPRPNSSTDYLVDTPEPRALLQRTFLGFKHDKCLATIEEEQRLMRVVHSEYVSPCSPRVLRRWGHSDGVEGPEEAAFEMAVGADPVLRATRAPDILTPDTGSPYEASSRFNALFESFPRTMIVVGDAERLVREVGNLQAAMEKDGVDVCAEWVKDAVHDVLIMNEDWWDKKVIEKVWGAVKAWAQELY